MILANLALRFIVELGGVAATGYAGFDAAGGGARGVLAGAIAATALMIAWGLVLAPSAANRLPLPARTALGTGVLVLAAGALALAGQPLLAIAFAAVTIANAAFLLSRPGTVDAVLTSTRGLGRQAGTR